MLSLYSHFSLILAIYAHILGTHAGLSSHLPPVSLILAIYAHILDKGTRNKMEDKFCNYILALILIFL